ncbi:DUF4232 domain-containing protein [Streptomyces sp. NPDC054796]
MREQQLHAARTAGRSEQNRSARRRVGRSTRLAAGVTVGLTVALLAGCGQESADASSPKMVTGEAAPLPGDSAAGGAKKGSATPSSSSPSRDGEDGADKASPGESGKDGAASTGSGGGSGGTGGSGGGAGGSGPCKTAQLDFSTSEGAAAGNLLVHMKNTGSASCTLRGFPGVDLNGEAGSFNADRSNAAPQTVSVQPGEATSFTLNYTPNDSSGSGTDVTSLVVTPPNETQSQTVPVSINLPVTDSPTPGVTVDPVGVG